jgi:hypothetical protein
MSKPKFTLRELQPSDGLALTNLLTEFDGDMTTRFQVDLCWLLVHPPGFV